MGVQNRRLLVAGNGHAAVVRSFEEALEAVGLAKPAKAA